MDDLDRLSRMSPADDPVIPPASDRGARRPRLDARMARLLAGFLLILVCGLLLLVAYGYATMATDPTLAPAAYWSGVRERLLGLDHAGRVAIPASAGLIVGLVLFAMGSARTRRESASPSPRPTPGGTIGGGQ